MRDIETLFEKLGVEKEEAAKAIGISRQYLWRVLKGKHEPTRPVINSILAFLNQPENLKRLGRRKPVGFEEVFGREVA